MTVRHMKTRLVSVIQSKFDFFKGVGQVLGLELEEEMLRAVRSASGVK